MSIHKIVEQNIVVPVTLQRSVMEQLLMQGGTDAHILLTESAGMGVNVM